MRRTGKQTILKRNAFFRMQDEKAKDSYGLNLYRVFEACVGKPVEETDKPLPDVLNAYLETVGRYPLLTGNEEYALGKKIKDGQDAERILNAEPELLGARKREITKEKAKYLHKHPEVKCVSYSDISDRFPDPLQEDYSYAFVMEEGDRARDLLINSNLRLVVSVAKKYTKQGMSIMDLIQEGNLGLYRAAQKFDYTMGNRFSTYATWWVKQSILRALQSQSRIIHVPVHVGELMDRIHKTERELSQKLGRDPDIHEIAEVMNDVSEERIRELKAVDQEELSLENLVGESDTSFLEIMEDENAISPREYGERNELCETIEAMLESLSKEEAMVLRMHYGLDGEEEKSYGLIARAMHTTAGKVKEIEARAMGKLLSSQELRKRELSL